MPASVDETLLRSIDGQNGPLPLELLPSGDASASAMHVLSSDEAVNAHVCYTFFERHLRTLAEAVSRGVRIDEANDFARLILNSRFLELLAPHNTTRKASNVGALGAAREREAASLAGGLRDDAGSHAIGSLLAVDSAHLRKLADELRIAAAAVPSHKTPKDRDGALVAIERKLELIAGQLAKLSSPCA